MADRSSSGPVGLETLTKSTPAEMGELSRANLTAMARTQKALLGGAMALQAELFAFAREETARGLDLHKALTGCESPQRAMELQLAYSRALAGAWLDRSRKLTEMGTGLARECWAPVEERVGEVAGKVTEAAGEATEAATGKTAGKAGSGRAA